MALDEWKVAHPLAKFITSWEAFIAPLGCAHGVGMKFLKIGLMEILVKRGMINGER